MQAFKTINKFVRFYTPDSKRTSAKPVCKNVHIGDNQIENAKFFRGSKPSTSYANKNLNFL
jgi:hypothetical protein